jgi:hypothetical protein
VPLPNFPAQSILFFLYSLLSSRVPPLTQIKSTSQTVSTSETHFLFSLFMEIPSFFSGFSWVQYLAKPSYNEQDVFLSEQECRFNLLVSAIHSLKTVFSRKDYSDILTYQTVFPVAWQCLKFLYYRTHIFT